MNKVISAIQRYSHLRVVRGFFGWNILDLQVVVHRVFLHLLVELCTVHFLIEQRELRIIEHYPVIVKGQNFILVCTDIYGVAEMIFITVFVLVGCCFRHLPFVVINILLR